MWISVKEINELSKQNEHKIRELECRELDECRKQVRSFIKTSAQCGLYESKIYKYSFRILKEILNELKDAGFGVSYSFEINDVGIKRLTHYIIKWDKHYNYVKFIPYEGSPSFIDHIRRMFKRAARS